jgi:hypothetical protein
MMSEPAKARSNKRTDSTVEFMSNQLIFKIIRSVFNKNVHFNPWADWGQKASAAIGFIKATETLRKKLHITLKKPQFH